MNSYKRGMKLKNKAFSTFCVLLIIFSMAGCIGTTDSSQSNSVPITTSGSNSIVSQIQSSVESNTESSVASTNLVENSSEMFSSSDKEIGYDESTAVKITLNGTIAESSDKTAVASGSTVTITDEGVYIISGTLSDGQIIVDAEKTDKLQIVLSNAEINSDTSAAIYVKQADKVFITIAKDTENILTQKSEYVQIDDNNIDSVIFSKDDLTLNGLGSLTINAAHGHGIVSKDDLAITSGIYNITAASHGIVGKDNVKIADGVITIASVKDGIHAENTEDTALGYIYIAGGTFNINAIADGIDASAYVNIDGGEFNLTTGGGSANSSMAVNKESQPAWDNQEGSTAEDSTIVSAKGIKAGGDLTINAGVFTIDSLNDSLHSNANVTVNGDIINISSGDDGIHADAEVKIIDGSIAITKSYEGIEGKSIEISGGKIDLVSTDDGLNSAGGDDGPGMGSTDCYIKISGGEVNLNTYADGIDSNGNLYISGGETYVSGSIDSGNSALDCDGEATVTGGIFAATGFSQMAQNFGSNSTQGTILVNIASVQEANSVVTLTDASKKTLLTYTPAKEYNSVIVTAPTIENGKTYTLTAGSETQTIEMTSLIYGESQGMGGRGGNPGMDRQKPMNGDML